MALYGHYTLFYEDLTALWNFLFVAFMSPRRRIGSVFIRTLVTVFYKYAHIHHIEEMVKIVRFHYLSFQ